MHLLAGDAALRALEAGGVEPLDADAARFKEATEEIARLHVATQDVLPAWTDQLRA